MYSVNDAAELLLFPHLLRNFLIILEVKEILKESKSSRGMHSMNDAAELFFSYLLRNLLIIL